MCSAVQHLDSVIQCPWSTCTCTVLVYVSLTYTCMYIVDDSSHSEDGSEQDSEEDSEQDSDEDEETSSEEDALENLRKHYVKV